MSKKANIKRAFVLACLSEGVEKADEVVHQAFSLKKLTKQSVAAYKAHITMDRYRKDGKFFTR